MVGGVGPLLTTFSALVSVAVGCLWWSGRRSSLNDLVLLCAWAVGGGGGLMLADASVMLALMRVRDLTENSHLCIFYYVVCQVKRITLYFLKAR